MSVGKYVVGKTSLKYKPSTSFSSSSSKVELYDEKENTSSSSSASIIPQYIKRIFTIDHHPLRTEYALLTYDQFCELPNGNGGFQGVVPWYIDQDGSIQFILNISQKYKLLSYIGGGLRAKETPKNSLYREIGEETPQWSDYLIYLLENPSYQKFLIVKDEYYPNNPSKNRGHIRLSTTIYLRVDPTIINEDTFQPSSEVDRLYQIALDDLPFYKPVNNYVMIWEGTENGLSNGVNDMVTLLTNQKLFSYLWFYIRQNITRAEYVTYLKWLYQTTNVENKISWLNTLPFFSSSDPSIPRNLSYNSAQKFVPRSASRSASRSSSRSASRSASRSSSRSASRSSSRSSSRSASRSASRSPSRSPSRPPRKSTQKVSSKKKSHKKTKKRK